ncbi:hypothetical protein CTRI78_v006171 [Colletotrichum trifolii]|uniref:Uncharacterized protein n=1 Tax=Colletotrichum trifolii TaxID=5466 RepID=A0A4R8RD97_COLTR|nr:hypothetical protein CTRI78_v006171 [Colletotrichum trifolii]
MMCRSTVWSMSEIVVQSAFGLGSDASAILSSPIINLIKSISSNLFNLRDRLPTIPFEDMLSSQHMDRRQNQDRQLWAVAACNLTTEAGFQEPHLNFHYGSIAYFASQGQGSAWLGAPPCHAPLAWVRSDNLIALRSLPVYRHRCGIAHLTRTEISHSAVVSSTPPTLARYPLATRSIAPGLKQS